MDDVVRAVQSLNQRGGRMLSIIDLIKARTLTPESAAYLVRKMSEGPSVISGAVPGGAGKTTLLGALLGLLPATAEFIVVSSADVLQTPVREAHFLVHEFGSGPWFGYVWGDDVRLLFSRLVESFRLAATIHANTPDEVRKQLCGPPNNAAEEAFRSVGLLVFILPMRSGRRVTSIWEADRAGGHRCVFKYDKKADGLVWCDGRFPAQEFSRELALVDELTSQGVCLLEDVRARILDS